MSALQKPLLAILLILEPGTGLSNIPFCSSYLSKAQSSPWGYGGCQTHSEGIFILPTCPCLAISVSSSTAPGRAHGETERHFQRATHPMSQTAVLGWDKHWGTWGFIKTILNKGWGGVGKALQILLCWVIVNIFNRFDTSLRVLKDNPKQCRWSHFCLA